MTVRIGVLSTALINGNALLEPALVVPEAEVTAVASRDEAKAKVYAAENGIPRWFGDYDEMLADDQIDAVYIGLPIGMHGHWTIRALQAGKHVLCEKALTANAAEAEEVRDVVDQTGLVMMHAFHNRYHALLGRVQEIIASGELGEITHLEADFDVPDMAPGNIRWNYELGGGVTPDIGLYPIDLVRVLAGRQPAVTKVEYLASKDDPRVDAVLEAYLDFGDGLTGRIRGTMGQGGEPRQTALVTGTQGTLAIDKFVHPQNGNQLVTTVDGRERVERVPDKPTSYAAQLSAFCAAITDGTPFETDATDAIATMMVIDDCYRVAGLPLRMPTPL